jgi:hypothetical protein
MVFMPQLFANRLLSRTLLVVFLVLVQGLAVAGGLPSSRVSDVRNTKHNLGILSSTASRTVIADTEDEICVFCHTPHGAEMTQGPLWNRNLSTATYDTYNSGSLDATLEGVALDQPNGISKLCLSCHDGTIAVGSVRVLNGAVATGLISMAGVETDGTMPVGLGVTTGFTRRIGTDLTNDHPISFTYDSALATKDGELRDPANEANIGNRSPGVTPHVPLENDQLQCNSCHDPHIRDAVDASKSIKFLRLNRFQKVSPTATTFDETNDIICLACHDKQGWVGSAHATDLVANEVYTDAAANLHDFPDSTQGYTEVWEVACLACHDTHAVQGSRRLLREGTDGSLGASGEKIGGNAAIEETCYACHSADGGTLVGQGVALFAVPDIKTDFTTTGAYASHMPITNDEQVAGTEVHDIGTVDSDTDETSERGKDFIESRGILGKASFGGTLDNRHAECTDCHNPHRVTKRRSFLDNNLGGIQDAAGTHDHDVSSHTNIASGVLRGTFGVEPTYSSNDFNLDPSASITYSVKRGDPGASGYGGGTTAVTEPYVTREYQICLKCHSNYAFDSPPALGLSSATTAWDTNHMQQYTDQAVEYNSPDSHADEPLSMGTDGGADSQFNSNNHRGWHPVMRSTGRTAAERIADANNWLAPFNADVGNQTMYCTDCHGSAITGNTVDPDGAGEENGAAWGPHGSTNPFILKGDWSGNASGSSTNDFTDRPGTGENTDSTDHLCFKCHDYEQYATSGGTLQASGFGGSSCGMMCSPGTDRINMHKFHVGMLSDWRCTMCHVAVPHGWKNKAFLVNLNDVGPEGGFGGTGNQVRNSTTKAYVNGPYYDRAVLKVDTFASSGNWDAANCGSVGSPGNGSTGVSWMTGSEGCDNVP